jgi:hypothetical protein
LAQSEVEEDERTFEIQDHAAKPLLPRGLTGP